MAPSESMGPPNPTRQRALIGADVLAKIKRLQRFWGEGGTTHDSMDDGGGSACSVVV